MRSDIGMIAGIPCAPGVQPMYLAPFAEVEPCAPTSSPASR